MSLTFEDYLCADYTKTWDTPIDLRWLFDALEPWPGLCWLRRCDRFHLHAQISGVPAFDWEETTPIEIRLVETPNLDIWTLELVLRELNKRAHMSYLCEERHRNWFEDLVERLPPITVDYVGRA
jgi:hypothetical protein